MLPTVMMLKQKPPAAMMVTRSQRRLFKFLRF
jgi:hypothetical protein